jgi:hypothetical protein
MNPARRWPSAFTSLFIVSSLLAGRPVAATVELGGLRQVRVKVEQAEGKYLVQARMLPVSAFDAATNARLNRERARQYALTGLARHLAGDSKAQFEIAGAVVVRTAQEGKFFTLALSVPRTGVKVLPAGGAVDLVADPEKPVRVDPFASPFFTRKSDHLHTLALLAAGLKADLRSAERKVEKDGKQAPAFLLAIAELEERGDDCFGKALAEVKGDRLLLKLEREEVLSALEERCKRWRQALIAAAKRYEKPFEEKDK